MDTNLDRVARPARKLAKSAVVVLALLFVMLRPVCEAFAASGEWHAPGQAGHGAAHMTGASAGGHFDDGVCCTSADVKALTVRATAPPLLLSPGTPALPFFSSLRPSIPPALLINVFARRDSAPPLPYHARSLRRLD